MEKEAFRRLDSEVLEELGVLHRQLHHLPDSLKLLVKPADVFVRYASNLFLPLDRRGAHFDPGVLSHHNAGGRTGAHHLQLQPHAEDRHDHHVALGHRLVHQLNPYDSPEIPYEWKRLERSKDNPGGGLDAALRYLDEISHGHPGVPPDLGVDPNYACAIVVGVGRPHNGKGVLLPRYRHYVAGLQVQLPDSHAVNSRYLSPYVPLLGLRGPQAHISLPWQTV